MKHTVRLQAFYEIIPDDELMEMLDVYTVLLKELYINKNAVAQFENCYRILHEVIQELSRRKMSDYLMQ